MIVPYWNYIADFDKINEPEMYTNVIAPAQSDTEILCCFPIMQELRPHLTNAQDFLQRVRRQQANGYLLEVMRCDGQPVALVGYRFQQNLVHGYFVYVDDLVTTASMRGKRLGERLLEHVFCEASKNMCNKVILDTGLANNLAQRFYYRAGMLATGLHFGLVLH